VALLFDTGAVSELTKPTPNAGFVSWSEAHAGEEAFLGAPTLSELVQGTHQLLPSEQSERLMAWLMQVETYYSERILPFDQVAARAWGAAMGSARRRGRKYPIIDSQLAAIAFVNDLTIVTRNVAHFDIPEFEGLKVVNPWR
jgi:predicted nucleic acid-binding protein